MAFQRHLASLLFKSVATLNRRFLLVTLAVTLLAAVSACDSGSSEPTPGIETPTTIAVPTATPPPTPTPWPSVIVPPTSTVQTSLEVSVPNCDVGGRSSSGSLGTAPGPTPTPLPDTGSRGNETIRQELGVYFASALPIVEHMTSWSDEFNSDWASDLSEFEQAKKLQVFGSRASFACDAVAHIDAVPPEATGFDSQLREAIRVRHAWVTLAIAELNCCENAITEETDIGNYNTSSLVAEIPDAVSDIVQQYSVPRPDTGNIFIESIGVELEPSDGWFLSGSSLSPVLIAPFELNGQDISGLGPERWQLGTAIRIRRLRNPEPLDVSESSSRFEAIITRQGRVDSSSEITLAGISAVQHVLQPVHESWEATVTVLVDGDFTYFVEWGCPGDIQGACDSAAAIAGSLALSG